MTNKKTSTANKTLTGKQIMELILKENGFDKEYSFGELKQTAKNPRKKKKEPKLLSEISEVVLEYNRLALRVFDPMAARKFGLNDRYVRYEFDGSTMFVYENESEPSSWSFDCGRGSYTLVDNEVARFRNVVKQTMKEAISRDLKLAKKVPTEITLELRRY